MKQEKLLKPSNTPELSPPSPDQNLESIKAIFFDPQKISETHDPEGWENLETQIQELRHQEQEIRSQISNLEKEISELKDNLTSKQASQVANKSNLNKRRNQFTWKFKNFIGIYDATLADLKDDRTILREEIDKIGRNIANLEHQKAKLEDQLTELQNPEDLISAYNKEISKTPLTLEEKEEFLKPEILSQLTTEEYIALWRRLNPYYLSHVTRQGFRDHFASMYHTGGLNEFHNGLVEITSDQKELKPAITTRQKLASYDKESVYEYIKGSVLTAQNPQEAKQMLENFLHSSLASAPNYPDITSLHLANETVSDATYGGEHKNEVFFIFPADYIASQYNYAFGGWEKDFTKAQSEVKWNDVFIWPKEGNRPTLPLDSGFVFLPQSTQVDPETGSQYLSEIQNIEGEEKRVLIEDTDLAKKFINWAESLNPNSPIIKEYNAACETNLDERTQAFKKFKENLLSQLTELGFQETPAQRIITELLANDKLGAVTSYGKLGLSDNPTSEVAHHALKQSGALWKRPTETISSQEFWETHFTLHPNQKPAHIIFYDGSPTTAVQNFLKESQILPEQPTPEQSHTANLTSALSSSITQPSSVTQPQAAPPEKLLGFDKNHITNMANDPRSNPGLEQLEKVALEIIEEHFQER